MKDEERFDLITTEIYRLVIKYVRCRLELEDFHKAIDELSVSENFPKNKMLEYAKKAIFYEAFEHSKGMKGEKKLAVKDMMNTFIESCEKILNENG